MAIIDHCTLSVLIRAGLEGVLPKIYGALVTPDIVSAVEAQHPRTPPIVSNFHLSPPSWLERATPKERAVFEEDLGRGEAAGIQLALERGEKVFVTDDRDAKRVCREHGIEAHGVEAILARAERLGLVNVEDAIQRLPRDYTVKAERLERARAELLVNLATEITPQKGDAWPRRVEREVNGKTVAMQCASCEEAQAFERAPICRALDHATKQDGPAPEVRLRAFMGTKVLDVAGQDLTLEQRLRLR